MLLSSPYIRPSIGGRNYRRCDSTRNLWDTETWQRASFGLKNGSVLCQPSLSAPTAVATSECHCLYLREQLRRKKASASSSLSTNARARSKASKCAGATDCRGESNWSRSTSTRFRATKSGAPRYNIAPANSEGSYDTNYDTTQRLARSDHDVSYGKDWSGREDLNLRPPGPEPGALPG